MEEGAGGLAGQGRGGPVGGRAILGEEKDMVRVEGEAHGLARLHPMDTMDEGDDAVDAGLVLDRRGRGHRAGNAMTMTMAVIGMDEGFRAGDLRQGDPRLDDGARLVLALGASALQMMGADAGQIAPVGKIAMPRRGGEMDAMRAVEGQAALFDLQDVEGRIGKGAGGQKVLRAAIDVRRLAELGDAAFRQRCRTPAQKQRFVRLGGGIDEDRAGLGEDLGQLLAQFLAQLVVEIGERLVEKHELGALDEGARQRRALLLAAREFERRAIEKARQLHQLGRLLHLVRNDRFRLLLKAQGRGDVLEDREGRIVDELLIDHGDVALAHGNPGHVAPVHHDRSRCRLVQPGHQAHQGRLAGKRRPEQDIDAAPGKLQRNVHDVTLPANAPVHPFEFKHLSNPPDDDRRDRFWSPISPFSSSAAPPPGLRRSNPSACALCFGAGGASSIRDLAKSSSRGACRPCRASAEASRLPRACAA